MGRQRHSGKRIRNVAGNRSRDPNCCCCKCPSLEECLEFDEGTGLWTVDMEVVFAGIVNGTACSVGCSGTNRTVVFSLDGTLLLGVRCYFVRNFTADCAPCFAGCAGNIRIFPCDNPPRFAVDYTTGDYELTGSAALDAIDDLCAGLDVSLPPIPQTALCNNVSSTCTVRLI